MNEKEVNLEIRLTILELKVQALEDKSPAARSKAKHLIDPDWKPGEDLKQWTKENYPELELNNEADRFRDYWIAAGQRYSDWNAAFRNWIRKSTQFSKAKVGSSQTGSAGRAAAVTEDNRTKRDRALDKLASLRRDHT